jgi:DNA invertase Pin-like site-specific DNA recombinase
VNRRQLLGLAGGAAASAVVVGVTAPPAQAFLPLLFRMLMGTAAREAWKETKAEYKAKKAAANAKGKKRKPRRKRQLQHK